MATGIGGEVSWWCPSLQEYDTETADLHDLVRNNKGTLSHATPASAWVDDTDESGSKAIVCDGTDNAGIGNPSTLDVSQFSGLSLAAWAKPTVDNYNGLFAKGTSFGSVSTYEVQLGFYAFGRLVFAVTNGSAVIASIGPDAGNTIVNAWTHYAATWTGDTTADGIAIYRNGVLVATATASGAIADAANNRNWYIGGNGGNGLTGRLDDARIFSRALTAGEVANLASRRAYEPDSGGSSSFTGIGRYRRLGT